MYQVVGDLTRPLRSSLQEKLHIRTDCCSYRLLQRLVTFIFVDFAWLFFRADSLTYAIQMLKHSVTHMDLLTFFNPSTLLGINTMALSEKSFFVMLLGLILLMWVDYRKKERNGFQGNAGAAEYLVPLAGLLRFDFLHSHFRHLWSGIRRLCVYLFPVLVGRL